MSRSRRTSHYVLYAKLLVNGVSFNFRFNYLPADLANTTIQLREPRAAKGEGDELEQVTES